MSESLLITLIILPIAISIVIMFLFRGKGPSTVDQNSHNDH